MTNMQLFREVQDYALKGPFKAQEGAAWPCWHGTTSLPFYFIPQSQGYPVYPRQDLFHITQIISKQSEQK